MKLRKRVLILLVLALATVPQGWGAPPGDIRHALETAYQAADEAVSLKFFDGVLALRAPGFRAYGDAGIPMNVGQADQRFKELCKVAVTMKSTSHIDSWRPLDASHAVCRLTGTLSVLQYDPALGQSTTLNTVCVSDDTWVLLKSGWRMASSRVVQQRTTLR